MILARKDSAWPLKQCLGAIFFLTRYGLFPCTSCVVRLENLILGGHLLPRSCYRRNVGGNGYFLA